MSSRLVRALPYAALAAAAALVIVLGMQKRRLVERYERLQRRYTEARTQLLPGDYVPAVATATLGGQPVTVGQLPAEGRQVLLVYTVQCPYCRSSLPAWKRLAAAVDTIAAPPAEVYGVSLSREDSTRAYAAEHALPYPTVRFPDEKTVSLYRAGTVPLVLVLDEGGRVIYSRVGEMKQQATIDSVIAAVRWRPPPPRSAAR
ncbi:MAG TPA: TlpA disulfide reductase family protein [Longimicrobium sp.]|nr:TlpA disulfide reductase family protein [Longimicrobium sp.]